MCNPALGVMGTQALGVGMSTVGAFFQARQEKRSLQHQAKLAEINASISDAAARNALFAGGVEESRVKLAGSQAKAQQRAQITSSGIDIAGSNTALARLTGTDLVTEVDANTVRANALRAAWGARIDAGNQRRGAASMRASAAGISPWMSGATSLITGAGQVASSWYAMNQQGAFSSTPTGSTPQVEIANGPVHGQVGHEPWQRMPPVDPAIEGLIWPRTALERKYRG